MARLIGLTAVHFPWLWARTPAWLLCEAVCQLLCRWLEVSYPAWYWVIHDTFPHVTGFGRFIQTLSVELKYEAAHSLCLTVILDSPLARYCDSSWWPRPQKGLKYRITCIKIHCKICFSIFEQSKNSACTSILPRSIFRWQSCTWHTRTHNLSDRFRS